MPKILPFIIFFTTAILIVSSVHYYLWTKLFRNTGLPDSWKKIGFYLLITFIILIFSSIIVSRSLPLNVSQPLLWITFFWLGTMMLLFITFLFTDVVKLILYLSSKLTVSQSTAVNLERRQFVSGLIALGASAAVFTTAGVSVFNYYSTPVIKKINVALKGLPKVFNGFKIVQISDLHIGQLLTKSRLEDIVQQVNSLNPDLIAITGDLVDGSFNKLAGEIAPIKNLIAKYGVFFVTGNHEYYSGVENWINEIERLGTKVLDNKNVEITNADASFYIAGVNDHEAKRFGENHAPDFKGALSGVKENKPVVLLAHQPIAVQEAANYDVDLVLSGHTHGGQIWPFKYLVYLQQPYIKGMYEYKNSKVYVNQGTGCWGPPMRLGTTNEITEITLKS